MFSIDRYKSSIRYILKKAKEPIDDQEEIEFTRLGEGKGFTSTLYSLRIGRRCYAVKITDPRTMTDDFLFKSGQHNREFAMYEWFRDYLEDSRTGKYSGDLNKCVKYYGGVRCDNRQAGILVVDDLSSIAISENITISDLSLNTIYSIIDAIIAYQCAFLSWDSELGIKPKSESVFKVFSESVLECIKKLPKKRWLTPERIRVLTEWASPESLKSCEYGVGEEEVLPILIHGDLWMNNMLFTKEKNDFNLLAIIDWQAAVIGNPLIDFASIIGVLLSPISRRTNERIILKYYLDGLNKNCHRFVRNFRMNFDQVLSMYKKSLRFAAIQLILELGYRPYEDIIQDQLIDNKSIDEIDGLVSERLRGILEEVID